MARLIAVLGFAVFGAFAVPLQAAAGTGVAGQLVLSPASGVQGSHFTATFTFTATMCNRFGVDFWWDSTHLLGSAKDPSSGQSCQASINATVPNADADPGSSHTIAAASHTLGGVSVDDGPGPSASSAFEVLQPSSGGTPPASSPAQHAATSSSATPSGAGTSAVSAASTDEQSTTTADGTATDTESSTDSETSDSTPTPQASQSIPPLATASPAPRGGGMIAVLAGLAACLAVFVAAAVAHRAGRLRLPRRG